MASSELIPELRLLVGSLASGDLQVQGQEAAQDLAAGGGADSVTGLAALVLVKPMVGIDVSPAVAGENRTVYRRVQFAAAAFEVSFTSEAERSPAGPAPPATSNR